MLIQDAVGFGVPLLDRSDELAVIINGKKYVPPFPLKNNDTYVGIEVEVERVFRTGGILALNDTYLWSNIEDGSLRNNGREFVSIPVKGINIQFAINQLHSTLTKEKSCIGHEFTDRTSVHVHMNVRDLTCKQLMNLILTYLVVEPLLYEFVGGDRAKNIFCVPLTQSSMLRDLAKMFYRLESKNDAALLDMFGRWQKYTGLNLTPVTNYGTIEYRHMCGTCDETVLSQWLNLILAIKNFAISTEYESNKARILNMNTTSEYSMYVHEIFGNDTNQFNSAQLNSTMEQTSMFVKDVYSILDNDTKSLFTPEMKTAIKGSGDNLFFEHAYKHGFLIKIDLEEKLKELNETIRLCDESIAARNREISKLERDLKSTEITSTTKSKMKSNIKYHKDYIANYLHQKEEVKRQIESLTSEPKEISGKSLSQYAAELAEARQITTRTIRTTDLGEWMPPPRLRAGDVVRTTRPMVLDDVESTGVSPWNMWENPPENPDNTDTEEDF
jgi:hypothetical protein